MNIESVELGWIITDKNSSQVESPTVFFDIQHPETDDNGHVVPGTADLNRGEPLYFETHPLSPNRVFVQMYELEHGFTDFSEPADLGKLVRDAVGESYNVDWGIIETQR